MTPSLLPPNLIATSSLKSIPVAPPTPAAEPQVKVVGVEESANKACPAVGATAGSVSVTLDAIAAGACKAM